MDNTMALLLSDTYKQCHDRMYPNGLTKLVSYWVPRKSMLENQNEMVFFGLQAFIKEYLMGYFQKNFFDLSEDEMLTLYTDSMDVQILSFDARICYHNKEHMDSVVKGSPFATAYFCRDLLPKDLIVEKLVTYERPLGE